MLIGERDVTRLQPRDRDIAMVFQSYALYPHMTVGDNIAYPLRIRKVPPAERTRKVAEVTQALEVDHLLDRYPRQLSGGQRQRIALARAIVRDPAAFLMDEPLSNLDARLRLTMRGEIKRLCQRLGATTLYVTHDQAEALTMADLVAVMRDGELQQVGTAGRDLRSARQSLRGDVRRQPADELPARCRIDEGGLHVGGAHAAARPGTAPRPACAGKRHAKRASGPRTSGSSMLAGPDVLKGEVYVVEPMGNETLVDVRVGDERLTVRARRGFRAAGRLRRWRHYFDPADACFFDASGLTVVHRAPNKGGKQ